MPKQGANPIAWMAGCATVCIVIAGCTGTLEVPTVSYADYQKKDKIKLHIELRLTEEFRNAKSEGRSGLDKIIIPLGDHLAVNAELLARAVFTDISVARNGTGSEREKVDAVLIPTMIASHRVDPISAYVRQAWKFVVILEWALKDPDNNPIWIDTITGEGKLPELRTSGVENRRKLMESLIQDLFQKSYDAISSSPEMRNFATSRGASDNKD